MNRMGSNIEDILKIYEAGLIEQSDNLSIQEIKKDPKKFLKELSEYAKKSFIEMDTYLFEEHKRDPYFSFVQRRIYDLFEKNMEKGTIDEIFYEYKIFTEYIPTQAKDIKRLDLDPYAELNENQVLHLIDFYKKCYDMYDQAMDVITSVVLALLDKNFKKEKVQELGVKKRKQIFEDYEEGLSYLFLNDDYRYVRNSIAHSTKRILTDKQRVKFINRKKELEFDFFEFFQFLDHLYKWFIAHEYAYKRVFAKYTKKIYDDF